MRKIHQDFEALYPGRRSSYLKFPGACLTHPGFLACFMLRIQELLYFSGLRSISSLVRVLNNALTGADFVPGCSVGPGLILHHPTGIVVGRGVTIGANCTLLQGVTLGENYKDNNRNSGYPRVEDNVIVGANSSVLGMITLGDGCKIGANSVVLHDVPAGKVAVGQPARII